MRLENGVLRNFVDPVELADNLTFQDVGSSDSARFGFPASSASK